jgi:hypothetical protein
VEAVARINAQHCQTNAKHPQKKEKPNEVVGKTIPHFRSMTGFVLSSNCEAAIHALRPTQSSLSDLECGDQAPLLDFWIRRQAPCPNIQKRSELSALQFQKLLCGDSNLIPAHFAI